MASVDELKQERTDLKKKVTIAARRLDGSIDRSQTEDIIHKFASELEAGYSDFLGVHGDYEELVNSDPSLSEHATVNGLTCSQYLESVTKVHMNLQCRTSKNLERQKQGNMLNQY